MWLDWGNRIGIEKGVELSIVDFHSKPFGIWKFSLLFDKNFKRFYWKEQTYDLEYAFHSHL